MDSNWVKVYESPYDVRDEEKLWLHELLGDEGIEYQTEVTFGYMGIKNPVAHYTLETYVQRCDEDAVIGFIDEYNDEENIVFDQDDFDELSEGLLQVTCPECKEEHDMDYAKCPYCGYLY